jgi:rhodanese-related sulfurtransferase
MTYKRIALLLVLMMAMVTTSAMATGYNYVTPEVFKVWLESGKEVVIVDIQAPEEFGKRHFRGSLETNAYPAKTEEEHARIDQILTRINTTSLEVVIVCPRGGGGARNTYDYLRSKGVLAERLYILEKGIEGWPYPEMCVSDR